VHMLLGCPSERQSRAISSELPGFHDQLSFIDTTPLPCGQSVQTANHSELARRPHTRWPDHTNRGPRPRPQRGHPPQLATPRTRTRAQRLRPLTDQASRSGVCIYESRCNRSDSGSGRRTCAPVDAPVRAPLRLSIGRHVRRNLVTILTSRTTAKC
jgi:hypothetical protein